jgi:hypothetical protein
MRKHDDRPRFGALEDALGGVWATARMAWSVNNVERAIEREEWVRALENLENIADRIEDESVHRLAWRELVDGAIWLGPRIRNWREIIDLVDSYGQKAWSDERLERMPWSVAMLFDEFDRADDAARPTALRLARIIEEQAPRCPLGAYASGHFAEDADVSIARFIRAAELFDELELVELAAHCQMRAGATAVLESKDATRGRDLLAAAREDLDAHEDLLWWAIGMSQSDKWLDRVRAADALLDLYERRDRREDGFPEDLGHAVIWMVGQAPLRMQATERDRLESLVEDGLPAEAQAPMMEQLAGRDAMAELVARPVSELRDALDLRGEPGDDPRDAYYYAVAALESPDLYGKPDTDAFRDELPVAADVVDILSSIRRDNPGSVATNSGLLEKTFRDGLPSDAHLGPLALLWPRVLSYLSGLRSDEDADTMTVKRITASLSEVASRALPDASAPSYGWWSLAANFLSAGMDEASRICAERAIRAGESLDESLEDEVLVRVIDHVIGADVSDEQLIWWLEQGEARL